LWLWLWNAQLESFSWGFTGTSQFGYVGGLAAEPFAEQMSIMQLEVPLFTLATAFNMSYIANTTQTCDDFYTNTISLDSATAALLCADPSNTFNFM
jgi:hypothetical protein